MSTPTTIDASTGTFTGGSSKQTNHAGYTGAGFADFGGKGSTLTLKTPSTLPAGKYDVTLRYATTYYCPLALAINGAAVGTLPCKASGDWAKWATVVTSVTLNAGINTLVYTATTDNGGPNVDSLTLTLTAVAALPATPPVQSVPTIGNTGGSTAQAEQPKAFATIGICIGTDASGKSDLDNGYGVKAIQVGAPVVRMFFSFCTPGGGFNAGAWNPVKRNLDANPQLHAILMFGTSEGAKSVPPVADWIKMYQQAAAALAGYENRVLIEGCNEVNLNQYLPLGQNDGQVSDKVVQWVVNDHKLREQYLPKFVHAGPSIGWGDPKVHVAYVQAFKAAGLLTLLDYYTDHAYPDSPADLETQVGGVRGVIGDKIPLILSEVNFPKVVLASYSVDAAPYIAVLHKYNANPMIYRGLPHPKIGESAGACVFGSDGKVRANVVAAWGLKA